MNGTAFGPDLSLTPDQEGLLRTALSSNPQSSPQRAGKISKSPGSQKTNPQLGSAAMANGPSLYASPTQNGPDPSLISSLDESPLFEDLDDGNFEWENGGDQLFGDIPENDFNDDGELHDKRKASMGSEDGEEGASKRQEGDGKTPKKPGRKPLTAEPTTKRKAQNRAAQRAFRERKERHLKDLETKVDDLEKASEATNHENGRLRAQVDKLSTELKEYRKRLSLNSTGAGHSPPPTASRSQYKPDASDFQFAFPKFGDLPGASFLNNGSLAKTSASPQVQSPDSISGPPRKESSTSTKALSPTSSSGSYGAPLGEARPYKPPTNGANDFNNANLDDLTGLFSPSILETASRSNSNDYISYKGSPSTASSVKQASLSNNGVGPAVKTQRASSASMTNSPASSMSQIGQNSSYNTTPEPSADSPDNRKFSEGGLNTINEETGAQNGGKKILCDALATACGNTANPIPPMLSDSNTASAFSNSLKPPVTDVNGIDWMAQQNGGQFDPVLFGDYRDPQDNILNNTFDDFFTDAYPIQDFASPYNTGDALAPKPKRDLMHEIEIQQNGTDEEVVPGEKPQNFLGCDKLWERVQKSEKYTSGEDMDELCSQLKSKAKCSGSGAVIEEKDVDKILGPEPQKKKNDPFNMFN